MTDLADLQTVTRYTGGEILAGKTIHPQFTVTADPAGGALNTSTVQVYMTDTVTGVSTLVEWEEPTFPGDTMVVVAEVTFPDDIASRRQIVVTLDVDQGDVDLEAVEIVYDVIPRIGLLGPS